MNLFALCIRRPVFATVLSLVLLLIGAISYTRLAVREYPRIDEPVVSVQTDYTGASAEVIESQITKPLEDSLSGIEGVDVMTSQSRPGSSRINLRFTLDRDPDAAAAEVRDKVSRVRGRLPDTIDEPIIAKVEADSQPVMYLAVQAGALSPLQASDYVNRYVKPRLSVLPGAADVRIFGERKMTLRVWLDRARLAGFNLTAQDVEAALRDQNLELPSGRIESAQREFSIVAATDLQTPAQFAQIALVTVAGHTVRLGDVARIEPGPQDDRVISRFNGAAALNLGMIKQATANPLDLSAAVRAEVARLNPTLPSGMSLIVAYDSSVFIQESIHAVFKTIGEAIVLVVLVIFVFLRSLRATVIPIVTIPVSLVGAFALMYAFGFTVNTLTLLAMVLAIGLVVDDAIVVLENIFRHIEDGMPRRRAAVQGIQEIGFSVIAMTLTLAAVYAPLAFATGRTGRLFVEFALALAGSVVVSGFVALTLTPMMCAQLLRHQPRHGRVFMAVERVLDGLSHAYERGLERALARRWWVLIIAAGVLAAVFALFAVLRSELAPTEDRGVIFTNVSAPQGATVTATAESMQAIEAQYRALPESSGFSAIAGFPTVADGSVVLRLKPWAARERSQQEITRALESPLSAIPGVRAVASNPPSLGQSARSQPIEYVVLGQLPYAELDRLAQAFIAEAAKIPGIGTLQSDLRLNTPELRIELARDKLADLGIPVSTLAQTLETLLGGKQVTRYKDDGEQYDVMVQVAAGDRSTPADIGAIEVRAANGAMVPLANVVTVREGVAPQSLNHFNRLRSVTFTGNLSNDLSLGDALTALDGVAKRVLPPGMQTELNGQSREFRASSGDIYLIFLLALVFIYLVLAAQFESFIHPLIILFSVPLSLAGALAALWLSGGTLNIYSQIGLITLVGLITKHGILIVAFANQLREAGETAVAAVRVAAAQRLRPILMTTGAMVLSAIPLALSTGAGAESRQQIGWVIVGGMSVGTLLTLFVVPVVYTVLAGKRRTPADDEPSDEPIRLPNANPADK